MIPLNKACREFFNSHKLSDLILMIKLRVSLGESENGIGIGAVHNIGLGSGFSCGIFF